MVEHHIFWDRNDQNSILHYEDNLNKYIKLVNIELSNINGIQQVKGKNDDNKP